MNLPECSQMNPSQRREMIAQMKIAGPKKVRQCDHVKTNGEFCGSPALRGRNYCYFHLTYIGRRLRAERVHAQAKAKSPEATVVPLELPPLENADSIQVALMQVIDAILHNRIDTKRAGLVLYALQTASSNLAHGANFEHMQGTTVAAGYDDFEDDFELRDHAPELRADEAVEPATEEATEVAQRQDAVPTFAKIEAARKECEGRERLEITKDGTQVFHCDPVDSLFCSFMGPLSRARASGAEAVQKIEREAGSQRLELVSVFAPRSDEEDDAAEEETAA